MFRKVAVIAAVSMTFCATDSHAAGISALQARKAVGNWLKKDTVPLGAKIGDAPLSAVSYSNAVGTALFHAVTLRGGGFVVTSADDGIEPIIAISEGSNLVAEASNPLWTLLNKDISQRLSVLTARRMPLVGSGALLGQASILVAGSPEAQWADLLDDAQIAPQGLTSISDVRVAPVVLSHWGQSTVSGFWGSYNCYNYYTPNHYVCGCVATAMAQIMRKHCFPTSSVPARTFSCSVNGVSRQLTMLGGTYNWGNMVLQPDEGSDFAPSETVRASIGKLCYDAGVSVGMQYGAEQSGAFPVDVPEALVDVFGYASACMCGYWKSITEDDIQDAILANLDHGYPVFLAILGAPGGHAVVADGYGYHTGLRYIHLNLGWNKDGNGGYQNAWYNVPTVDTALGTFTVLTGIVYNIFPDTQKKLVSGRVLSAAGVPVANALVFVRDLETGVKLRTLQTNSKGIYTFAWNGSENWAGEAGFCATDNEYASGETAVTAHLSDMWECGNVWGADLTLSEPKVCAVELDVQGGNFDYYFVNACLGLSLPLIVDIPSRQGYRFEGFFDVAGNYGGTQYYDELMNPLGFWHDATVKVLYARWEPVAVQVGETFVPYAWLDSFNLGSEHEAAAFADQDGDGALTWWEYVAGTDPTNGLSVFRITDYSHNRIRWSPYLPDRIYTVFGKTNLTDGAESWTSPTNADHRFFRVKVRLR